MIPATRHHKPFVSYRYTCLPKTGNLCSTAWAEHVIVVVTTICRHIRTGEKRSTVIGDRLVPFQLIKRLHAQAITETLRDIEHIDRNQTFLDFRARAAESSSIEGVDGVDRITDKGAFAPAHHLASNTHCARQITQIIVVVQEGIEDFRTGGLCSLLAVAVADVLVQTAFVLQLEVVPVLAANEGATVAIAQLEVMHTLENLGEGFALFEVQTSIIAGLGKTCPTIGFTHQIHIRAIHGPTGPDRHGRVELTFYFPDVETDGISRCSSAQRNGEGQCLGLEESLPCCFCHEALLVGSKYAPP